MDYSWLWHSGQLADINLSLVIRDTTAHASEDEPPAKRRKQDAAHEQGTCAAALAVHSAVLATASGYWKSRLLNWDKKVVTPADTGTSPVAADAATSCWVLEEQVVSSEAAEAAQLVLRYAYTNTLPEPATVTTLVQMTVWADKWDMPSALSACLTAAATMKDLCLPDLECVLQYQLPDSITSKEEYKKLQQYLGQKVCQHVGPAQDVLVSADKLLSFCNLSLEAVLLWEEQDQLQTDSENTVAVLLTHWWDNNSNRLDAQQQDAAERKLTQVMRAGQLSRSFILCVLDQLPWFKCRTRALSLLRMLHGTDLQEQHQQIKDKIYAGWMLPQRVHAAKEVTPFHWAVTKAQLDELHNDAADGITTLFSPTFCWNGLLWEVALRLWSQKSALCLGLQYRPALPKGHAGLTPAVLIGSFKLGVSKVSGLKYQSFACTETNPFRRHGIRIAPVKFLGVPECQEPRTHSYPPDEFWKDGMLHLEAWVETLE